ncbi:hypothetical protein [Treponema phagedenis]|uniref:Lipoprotein n=1 Tax=Treponema phagedenis TaxID=162 RepID=A0A0B7GZB7_TREPH|nr:hypothetical protein [Treponema phagedenis]NVP24247.1 hypothetical protein [Treponema phagedenis]QEJ94222.1 hypothetical protein FUT79_02675 [Treponema phagedenis]QEJ99191.1 hypothetical protein FUT82_15145 [Treponema phagedenis]QEK00181.1 hypothetical protein FUT84_02620 [Treponema phagedenis]QEK04720.1 hypothetical protein FUT83_13545 [Treponema phagedenis]
MKTHVRNLFLMAVCFIFSVLSCYAENAEWQYTSDVFASSNGTKKIIYAKIDKQKTTNKILLVFKKYEDGSLLIESGSFKLGKMPFSSSFKFIIPKENLERNDEGLYDLKEIQGTYSVLASKKAAFLSGSFDEKTCNLTVKVTAMKKQVEIMLTRKTS